MPGTAQKVPTRLQDSGDQRKSKGINLKKQAEQFVKSLLATSLVSVSKGSGKEELRVLLDSSSQFNFITHELAKMLKLPLKREL